MKTNLALITAHLPSQTKETFLLDEISQLRKRFNVFIYPLKEDSCTSKSLNSFNYLASLLKFFITRPLRASKALWLLIRKSRGKKLLRNIIFLGRANDISNELATKNIDHIHAYWASSPSFCAMLLSDWLSKPFSFTAHRYDILENDFLKEKILKAKFVRTISDWGKKEICKLINLNELKKIMTIYLSIKLPPNYVKSDDYKKLNIAVIAALDERKGHRFLIDALAMIKNDCNFKAVFYGEGSLRNIIVDQIKQNNLNDKIFVRGYLRHDVLTKKLNKKEFNVIILPSLSEGLPAALIEGAANHILIIGPNRGGTGELIGTNSPFLIKDPTNPAEIAEILKSISKKSAAKAIAHNYQTIKLKFEAKKCTEQLAKAITK